MVYTVLVSRSVKCCYTCIRFYPGLEVTYQTVWDLPEVSGFTFEVNDKLIYPF